MMNCIHDVKKVGGGQLPPCPPPSSYPCAITLEWPDLPLTLIELHTLKCSHLQFQTTDLSTTLEISSTFNVAFKMIVNVSNVVHVDLLIQSVA